MKTRIHAIAGGIAFLTILTFWTSTVFSELFLDHAAIASVKAMILRGMFVLIPAMIVAGGSGMALGKNRTDHLVSGKKKRMPFIAGNGILILIPCALFLSDKASAGEFDTIFYIVQVVELFAGATNLTLLGMNIRDGLRMTGKIGSASEAANNAGTIRGLPNGAFLARDIPRLTDADGSEIEVKKSVTLCRCGASKSKPYCDNSHADIGFESSVSKDRTPDVLTAYQGKEITVHYNRLLCSHAGVCSNGLKPVFDSDRKPWIVPDNGDAGAIREIVAACPSGALSLSKPGDTPHQTGRSSVGITIERNGPYRVTGVAMPDVDWAEGASHYKYVLCRCGASKNKPFCDGTHVDIGWDDSAE